MSSATLTLYGTYKHLSQMDDDLFKNMSLPSGVDKTTLTENIILRGAEFEVLYSNPYFFQEAIGTWSRKWYRTIEKWIAALSIEYNPLENYDRIEDWTTTDNGTTSLSIDQNTSSSSEGSTTSTSEGSLSSSATGTDESSGTVSNSNSNSSENKVSAFNSSTYEPSTQSSSSSSDETTSENQSQNTMQNTGTSSDSTTGSNSDSSTGSLTSNNAGTSSNTNVRTGRAHGNIGVTTSQQMLQSELDIATWNIYEHITDIFLQEFVIPIY